VETDIADVRMRAGEDREVVPLENRHVVEADEIGVLDPQGELSAKMLNPLLRSLSMASRSVRRMTAGGDSNAAAWAQGLDLGA
jgi:hypothetical protein